MGCGREVDPGRVNKFIEDTPPVGHRLGLIHEHEGFGREQLAAVFGENPHALSLAHPGGTVR